METQAEQSPTGAFDALSPWEEAGFSGEPAVRVRLVDDAQAHGSRVVGEFRDHDTWFRVGDQQALPASPERPGYLDIETDGLHNGCISFCIGVAKWVDGGLECTQIALRSRDDEAYTLAFLADWLGDVDALVTFNGRAFDVPRLQARFRSLKLEDPFVALPHVDLMHVAKKMGYQSLTLSQFEARLGLHRTGDVPGSEAPKRWAQYLKTKHPAGLLPLFEHNHLDVVSLAALAAKLDVLPEPEPPEPPSQPEPEAPKTELTKKLQQTYRLRNTGSSKVRRTPPTESNTNTGPSLVQMRRQVEELQSQGKQEAALLVLHEILALAPTYNYALVELESHYRKSGRDDLATAFKRRLADLEPF